MIRKLCVTIGANIPSELAPICELRFNVDTGTGWVGALRVATAYCLKGSAFQDPEQIREAKELFADDNIVKLVTLYHAQLGFKDGFEAMKWIVTSPKPVTDQPPFSTCPRCEHRVWPETLLTDYGNGQLEPQDSEYYKRCQTAYKTNPIPAYCMNCGQRFKKNKDGNGNMLLAYKGDAKPSEVLHGLILAGMEQPSFDQLLEGGIEK